ncbi:MAG: hypothetical protein J2O49_09915, partial [Sciscionella sp.]|nr:hypothetical protein [Sciscionella sp.]
DDNAENLHGEPAVALVLDDGRNRTELLVDPANGRFIGERDTVSRADVRGLRPGTVTAFTAVRTATVDAIGEPPSR